MSGLVSAGLIDAARHYNELGWQLVAVAGKRPRRRWRNPPPLHVTERLLEDARSTGIAVILGTPSGDLIARDFDDPSSYRQWTEQHPDLARKLPTSRTPRPGYHVFARTAGAWRTQRLENGELRAEGAIIVLPPSRNLNGQAYAWAIEPSSEILIIDPIAVFGAAEVYGESSSACTGHTHDPNACNTSNSSNTCTEHMACVNSEQETLIYGAIMQSLPNGFGQRNRRIFDLARKLRTIVGPTTTPAILRPHVEAWHRAALLKIRTKEFHITWEEFLCAWQNVKQPEGASLGRIRNLALEDSFSLELGDIHLDTVARFFRAAARFHGDRESFYMPYRTLGKCVGLSPTAARKIALGLVDQGLLEIVENGTPGLRGKATVWRWIGPLD